MRVVYIASLGHSGSTLLTMLLGAHSRLVGLGEVTSLFDALDAGEVPGDQPCSCGATSSDCELWGPLLGKLADLSPAERYARLLDQAEAVFGPDVAIVDSSKDAGSLRQLTSVASADVSTILLVRDVRSWTVAFRDRSRRKGDFGWRNLVAEYGPRGVSRAAWRTGFGCFRLWQQTNRDLEATIADLRLPTTTVGYEPLAFTPRLVLELLLRRLGLDFEDQVLGPDPRVNHVLFGNRMAAQPDKLAAIRYDPRWLSRRSWILPSLVLRGVMRDNDRLVYGDPPDALWDR